MFHKLYPDNYRKPERVADPTKGHNWYVWCRMGALEALQSGDHVTWLEENPDKSFTVNFGNGGYADITPGHKLWQLMEEVAAEYCVRVYVLGLSGGYVPWSGEKGSCSQFDCIEITRRKD